MKTARFAEMVKAAGAPSTYLLWVAPEKDKTFQRALKEHRVMTVHQENVGTKKDFGSVGFVQEPHAEYLVFPKSVKHFEERRIVGINYALLAPESRPGEKPPVEEKKEPAWKRAKKPAPPREQKVIRFERPPIEAETESGDAADADRAGAPAEERKKVAREETARRRKATRTEIAPTRATGGWVGEVKRAMKELKAGKTVAAYERLQALVAREGEG